ncbi:MAG: ATP synthase F1 subunit gamma [Proteobacteria bacterium]|jgi:F-type H+-transporting ATPase subunit gamma|nr:ATP synthase F1 subunit gamma [Desulfocapsa sp.]MBU3943072.1 ATP synthase F1 subunit gamma [Pseudomonadota bacterium]MCG2744218.1 ATP synthase F1 subunit gamma [Desulfobacteraceae bacterium]MBU3983027.1 ATP synthase F1 subunit gamma [Pseudomonadota bacterium]MBU4027466.1 ATP synthase F1 subunit gamma [Pseudomonadota bacterium]
MASLKEVKNKIAGVKKTAQITKAMNMVASARLRGAQSKMEAFRPYSSKFEEAMSNLSGGANTGSFPLMEVRNVATVEIVIVTSDRGLCGSFNANINKLAEKKMKAYEAEGKKVSIVCVGKKGHQYFKKTGKVRKSYTNIMASFQMFHAREIAQDVADNFVKGAADKVEVLYGHFKSVAIQRPAVQDMLPVQPVANEQGGAKKAISGDYIYEPSTEEIMDVMQPLYLNVILYHAMLEVGASEHAARMTAMDNATSACRDIVNNLTLIYNKARQAAVTGELMDIVGGAEALKG